MDKHYAILNNQTEGYIAWFRRRLEVEREYADALRKLSSKQQELDRKLDDEDRGTYTTFRQAWVEVQRIVGEEARVHQLLGQRLESLVGVLTSFKDSKDRTRRRVKEEREGSAKEHLDYKGTVVRLRKTYERKIEEVQAQEHDDAMKELEREKEEATARGDPWPTESWSVTSEADRRNSSSSSRGGESGGSLSPTTTPNPPLVSGASSSSAGSASRDTPMAKAANAFDRHVNAKVFDRHVGNFVRAVGSLAKGEPGSSLGGVVRSVKTKQTTGKLKREAEQADKEYRSSVFKLESFRLRKERVALSSAASLREYAYELSAILKESFSHHLADLVTAGESRIAVATTKKQIVAAIDPGQDAIDLSKRLRDPTPPEPPVYYVNAFVGECRNLLFGVSLADYHATHPRQLVPLVVSRCIAEIDKSGLNAEGIYRISGKLATIQQIVLRIEKDEVAFEFDADEDPPNIAGVLKLYLRQLPLPLFPFPTADRLAFSNDYTAYPGDQHTALAALARRIKRLSTPHQATLKVLCEHLNRVVQHSSVNKMGATNLGLVFTPVVFGEEEGATLESAMHSAEDTTLSLIIANVEFLFEGLPAESAARSRSASLSQSVDNSPRMASRSSLHLVSTSEDGTLMPPASRIASDIPSDSLAPPVYPQSVPDLPSPSTDSIYGFYAESAAAFPPSIDTPIPESAEIAEHQLSSPSPPLSAAGGRYVT